jgi:hypothetical protein
VSNPYCHGPRRIETPGQLWRSSAAHLPEFGKFFVEVGQGGFERLTMIGISGGLQVVEDARAGQLDTLAFLIAESRFGGLFPVFGFCGRGPGCFHLRFHVLAFPATRHNNSVPQLGR